MEGGVFNMKLLRYGKNGVEKPALIDENGTIRDLSNIIHDLSGDNLMLENIEKLSNINFNDLPIISKKVRIGPCVGNVSNFFMRWA
jgi:ureidoglycolate lyase